MNEKEILLLNGLLNKFIEILTNNRCNDIDQRLIKDWTPEEVNQFTMEYHQFNGDYEHVKGEIGDGIFRIPDYAVVSLLQHKLLRDYPITRK